MKRKLGTLFLWFLLVELLYSNRVDLINSFDVSGMFDWAGSFQSFFQVLSGYIAFFAYSTGAYLLFFRFYPRKQYLWLSLAMIALIPSVIGFRFLLQEVVLEAILGFGNYREGVPWRYYVLDNLFFAIVFTGLGVVFYLVQYSRYSEAKQAALQVEQQKTELALLRAQINPHFLFNSLNNIYTLVYQQSEHALPAMEKLSGLLRYTLYEQADWVPIRKEMQSLQDFIALQTWRYPFEIDVRLEVDPQLSEQRIPPFLLIAFLENAFKHGDLAAPVVMELKAAEGNIVVHQHNKIAQRQKDSQGGIGLHNVRRRLSLLFEERFDLSIQQDKDKFQLDLRFPFAYETVSDHR